MSISSTGDSQRDPSVVRTGGAKAGAGRPGGKAGQGKPGGKGAGRPGGKGPRKPIKPVKVAGDRPWGPILLFSLVGLLAVGIVAFGVVAVVRNDSEVTADDIKGLSNFRKTDPKLVQGGDHKTGPIKYDVLPPVAGPHNARWQNCVGEVFDAPIANEHVVHSLEHGAVWITYRPDVAKDQVDKLAAKVRNRDRMILSPFPNLSAPISLQAWGYQLKLDSADDERVNQFIKAFRKNAAVENVPCSEGVTSTGTTPIDLPQGTPAG
ncbi:hypothetical protein GCM10010123_11090 [Pilimelia anulata]|uniref:DUF3105 domain-containing protein n=1 Tax=Pilimelia anulata TaxID=53371 RepID=A0A8J3B0J4_9ACTN|nr:DUF3105 domain-containing protein [Pilimelia anulata]GGJ83239.1 hypothetical protein GCM10010123_11090 [Pilimelia anulata]